MGIVPVYAGIEMKLSTAGFANLFQQPIQQFSAVTSIAKRAPADQVIDVQNPPPRQILRDPITRRRDNLIFHRQINQRIAVILHLALDLRDKIVLRKMRSQFVHRGEAGDDFGFGSDCLNIHRYCAPWVSNNPARFSTASPIILIHGSAYKPTPIITAQSKTAMISSRLRKSVNARAATLGLRAKKIR